jgi:hypothetical protein
VLGLGGEYRHYGDKIAAYHTYLSSPSLHHQPQTRILLIDAYDVLLFSGARPAALQRILAKISQPIVACAESGIYPEYASSFFYSRSTLPATLAPRFVSPQPLQLHAAVLTMSCDVF